MAWCWLVLPLCHCSRTFVKLCLVDVGLRLRVISLGYPLLLGTVNLMGLYAHPVGTSYVPFLLAACLVFVWLSPVKASTGAVVYLGYDGGESQTMVYVSGWPLPGLCNWTESLGLIVKGFFLFLNLLANLTAGTILTGVLCNCLRVYNFLRQTISVVSLWLTLGAIMVKRLIGCNLFGLWVVYIGVHFLTALLGQSVHSRGHFTIYFTLTILTSMLC